MGSKLITTSYRNHVVDQVLESVSEVSNTAYYLFAGKHTQYDDGDSTVETPVESDLYIDSVYSNMIFGKRVSANDVQKVITRHDWESGTAFAQYDDADDDLLTKSFYCTVNAGSNYHVYKCLFNNDGANSTVEPDFASVSVNDEYFETSDGYIWKYMFTVSDSLEEKFGTSTLFPVSSNSSVVNAATVGAIDIILVESSGNNYSNYLGGNNSFRSGDIKLDGNTLTYDISANLSASSSNDYYNGCYIYIKTGVGDEVGQYRKVSDYFVNSTCKVIVLDEEFAYDVGVSATFDIYPGVIITGDGSESVNAVGRAVVNNSTNTIHNVQMFNVGSEYKSANAYVYASPDITVTNAELRVVRSPYNGHGSNPEVELGCNTLAVSVSFVDSESNTVPYTNDYRTVGLISDPVFSSTRLTFADQSTFFVDEYIDKIAPIRLGTNASMNTTSAVITDPAGDFSNQFDVGDSVYFTYSISEFIGNAHMISTVSSITNSSQMSIASNSSFSKPTGGVYYFLANKTSNAVVTASSLGAINVANVQGTISSGDFIIGRTSGAYGVVNVVSRSGVEKDYNTFVYAHKYVCTVLSGEFTEDEELYQEASTSTGTLHSNDDGILYVTNLIGSFDSSKSIIGRESGARATILSHYGPEILFRSGNILYVENMEPVTRANTQTETFNINLRF